MAALPPPRARARHLLLATLAAAATASGLGYLVHIWPAPEPLRAPFARVDIVSEFPPDPEVHLGWGGAWYAPPLQCLEGLDSWMRLPEWDVVILRDRASISIASTGHATIIAGDAAPRSAFLSPTMLERLHRISEAGCRTRGWLEPHFVVRFGAVPDARTEWVHAGSPAYERLVRFVADAADSIEPAPPPLRLPEP